MLGFQIVVIVLYSNAISQYQEYIYIYPAFWPTDATADTNHNGEGSDNGEGNDNGGLNHK